MTLFSSFSQKKLQSSYFNCRVQQSKPLCSINFTFQNEIINIPIFSNSKIHQIANEISQNILAKQQLNHNQQLQQLQSFICFRLAEQIRRMIILKDEKTINESDAQWSDSLLHILACHLKYQESKDKKNQNQVIIFPQQDDEYAKQNLQNLNFTSSESKMKKNKISYFKDKLVDQNEKQTPVQTRSFKKQQSSIIQKDDLLINSNKFAKNKKNGLKSEKNIKKIQYCLYNKSKEQLTKRKQKVISRQRQKLKTQTKECTFHPDISLSNEKFKKIQKNNSSSKLFSTKKDISNKNSIFQKLYSNALESKSKKVFFRIKTEETMIQQEKKQLTFTPKINQCSRQIVRMKKKVYSPFKNNENQEQKQNWKQKTSTTCTDTHIFSQIKKNKPLAQVSSNKVQINKQISVFQNLFKSKSKQKKVNVEKQNKKFSFQPQLSKGTQKIIKQKQFPTLKQRIVVNENYFQKTTSKSSLMSIQKYLAEQQLKCQKKHFKNVVIDDQIKKQELQFLMQGDHSLSSINLTEGSNKKIQSQIYMLDQDKSKTIINNQGIKKSQKLFNNRKNKIFSQIFHKLIQVQVKRTSIEQNKQLTSQMIFNYKQFPDLGQQMQKMNVGLDQDEFVWSLSNTYEHLSLREKGILLGWGVKQLQCIQQY